MCSIYAYFSDSHGFIYIYIYRRIAFGRARPTTVQISQVIYIYTYVMCRMYYVNYSAGTYIPIWYRLDCRLNIIQGDFPVMVIPIFVNDEFIQTLIRGIFISTWVYSYEDNILNYRDFSYHDVSLKECSMGCGKINFIIFVTNESQYFLLSIVKQMIFYENAYVPI